MKGARYDRKRLSIIRNKDFELENVRNWLINLLMGKIKLRCLPYIISFVIVVIIPSIITLFGIKKMYKYDISKLSKGDK